MRGARRREGRGMEVPEPSWAVADFTRVSGYHRSTVYNLLRQQPNRLPPVLRLGRRIRFVGVREWMKKQQRAGNVSRVATTPGEPA
jgi:predicted DNA-binding transcriptional regulator AlpA